MSYYNLILPSSSFLERDVIHLDCFGLLKLTPKLYYSPKLSRSNYSIFLFIGISIQRKKILVDLFDIFFLNLSYSSYNMGSIYLLGSSFCHTCRSHLLFSVNYFKNLFVDSLFKGVFNNYVSCKYVL